MYMYITLRDNILSQARQTAFSELTNMYIYMYKQHVTFE